MAKWVLFNLHDDKHKDRKVLINLDRAEAIYEPDGGYFRILTADGRGHNVDCKAEDLLLLTNAQVMTL